MEKGKVRMKFMVVRSSVEAELFTLDVDGSAAMTPQELTAIWEADWGVRSASRIRFKAAASGSKCLSFRGDQIPTEPAVVTLETAPAASSVLMVLCTEFRKRGEAEMLRSGGRPDWKGWTQEEVWKESRQRQKMENMAELHSSPDASDLAQVRVQLGRPLSEMRAATARPQREQVASNGKSDGGDCKPTSAVLSSREEVFPASNHRGREKTFADVIGGSPEDAPTAATAIDASRLQPSEVAAPFWKEWLNAREDRALQSSSRRGGAGNAVAAEVAHAVVAEVATEDAGSEQRSLGTPVQTLPDASPPLVNGQARQKVAMEEGSQGRCDQHDVESLEPPAHLTGEQKAKWLERQERRRQNMTRRGERVQAMMSQVESSDHRRE